jgi:hypothetical protein
LLQKILPISGDEWDQVEQRHNNAFPGTKRTKEKLKRKFKDMYLKRPPTGDTTVTPVIELAISIYNKICMKAEISDGEEEATAKLGLFGQELEHLRLILWINTSK